MLSPKRGKVSNESCPEEVALVPVGELQLSQFKLHLRTTEQHVKPISAKHPIVVDTNITQ